jgi:DNA-binding transcriptional regulator YdaS (Cro superfamily)
MRKNKMIAEADGLEAAIIATGSRSELARRLGISRQAIHFWKKIPAERVVEIEQITGVPREIPRPDLYRRPKTEFKRS